MPARVRGHHPRTLGLEAGYLGRTSTREQAAIDLHLSRSAYFRHLRAAADRVVAEPVRAPMDAAGG